MSGLKTAGRSHCQNCGAVLSGPFCTQCGQHDVDYNRSVWHVAEEALEGFLHFDGKFFRSARYILTRPGFLTNEFNAGRRVSYTNPLRFYLFASFLFFAVGALTRHGRPDAANPDTKAEVEKMNKETQDELLENLKDAGVAAPTLKKAQETVEAKAAGKAAAEDAVKSAKGAGGDWLGDLVRSRSKQGGAEDEKEIARAREFIHLLPEILFFCIPILALVLKVVYFRSGRFYVEHLIFALHIQAFTFVFLLVTLLANSLAGLLGSRVETYINTALSLLMVWLVYRSFRTVYGQGRWRTVFKIMLVGAAYSMVIVMGLLGAAIASEYLASRGA